MGTNEVGKQHNKDQVCWVMAYLDHTLVGFTPTQFEEAIHPRGREKASARVHTRERVYICVRLVTYSHYSISRRALAP